QVDDYEQRKNFISVVQNSIRKFYVKLMLNKVLSLKYKVTITLLNVNKNLLILLKESRKRIKF
ncbi:hypothetical protein V7112_23580, partial [Bacillus sp. JJ1566]|uniref:hypothetical protein n=1 Tax=Bacillus sp. JJ1566 TaxID=3122961 RepID=UPI003000A0AF